MDPQKPPVNPPPIDPPNPPKPPIITMDMIGRRLTFRYADANMRALTLNLRPKSTPAALQSLIMAISKVQSVKPDQITTTIVQRLDY